MASTPTTAFLSGRLVVSQTGKDPWGMLLVPQALVDGLFASLDEHGVEKSPNRAHITVFTDDELNSIGQDKITERGKSYAFTLGSVRHVRPRGWKNYDRCWFVACHSPELEKLRVSYGLTPRPNNQQFHITFAVREAPAKTAGVNAALALSAIGGGLGGLADSWRNRNDDEVTRRRPWLARHAGLVSGLVLGGAAGAAKRPLRAALGRLRSMAPRPVPPPVTPPPVTAPPVTPPPPPAPRSSAVDAMSMEDIYRLGMDSGAGEFAINGLGQRRPPPAEVPPAPRPEHPVLDAIDVGAAGVGGAALLAGPARAAWSAAAEGGGAGAALRAAGGSAARLLPGVGKVVAGTTLAPVLGEMAGAEYTPAAKNVQRLLGGVAAVSPQAYLPTALILAPAANLMQSAAERPAGQSLTEWMTSPTPQATLDRLDGHMSRAADKPFWQRLVAPLADPVGWYGDVSYLPTAARRGYDLQREIDPKAGAGRLALRTLGITQPPLPEGVRIFK